MYVPDVAAALDELTVRSMNGVGLDVHLRDRATMGERSGRPAARRADPVLRGDRRRRRPVLRERPKARSACGSSPPSRRAAHPHLRRWTPRAVASCDRDAVPKPRFGSDAGDGGIERARAHDCTRTSAARSPISAVRDRRAPPATRPAPPATTNPPIEVAVLGTVQVNGAPESFRHRRRLTELVAYLAMHPEGATADAFATALWPERRVPLQTLANRLSEARRALGIASDGRPRLRKQSKRHLIVEAETDWDRFRDLASEGCGADSWRRALALVRGRPFEGLDRGEWAQLEGFVAAIDASVVGVACRLGEYSIGRGRARPRPLGGAARSARLALGRAAPPAPDAGGGRARQPGRRRRGAAEPRPRARARGRSAPRRTILRPRRSIAASPRPDAGANPGRDTRNRDPVRRSKVSTVAIDRQPEER